MEPESDGRMDEYELTLATTYLARVDKAIVKVLMGVAHCESFELGADNKWQEQKVAGCVYVLERNASPQYLLLVLSKSSLDKVEIPLTQNLLIEMKIAEDKRLHALYFKTANDPTGRTYCVNFERPSVLSDIYLLVENIKSEVRYREGFKHGLSETLKKLANDQDFLNGLLPRLLTSAVPPDPKPHADT